MPEGWNPTDGSAPRGAWQQIASGGTSTDNTTVPTAEGIGTAGNPGVSLLASPADHVHPNAGAGAPVNQAIGDAAATGIAGTYAESDHRHGMPGAGVPINQAIDDTAASGAAATVARSDHKHGMPAHGTPITQAFGDVAAAGAGPAVAFNDHKHGMPASEIGSSAPTSIAFGATAAVGAATTAARSDHRHAMESLRPSRGCSILTPAGAINIVVWRCPYPEGATVQAVKGFRKGGTDAKVNARKNGASNHLASDLDLTSTGAWLDGGAVQNTAYVTGDYLEVMLTSITGGPSEVDIQVDFTVP